MGAAPEMEPLLGTADVAKWLGMSREQVWRLWRAGRLPGYRLDRHLRFARSDVEAFLAAHRSGAAADNALTAVVLPIESKRRQRRLPPEGYSRI
ncbi:MAG: helix-turn-helix domain-containing protein [Thermoleophilia bacterium]|nr:helix-turn-helix domain-containing protein [Thermoleophilia bacterium]